VSLFAGGPNESLSFDYLAAEVAGNRREAQTAS
jgi:hypothetical protein